MDYAQHNSVVSFIWGIADDILRDVYVRGKYRDVILPMTVIRRLDAIIEPTKAAVLDMAKMLDRVGNANQEAGLCAASGHPFYNISPFTLRDMLSRGRQQQLEADFLTYLGGYSTNVQRILDKFKFRDQIRTLVDAGRLMPLVERFMDPRINLTTEPVLDGQGNVRLPALDNHGMGTVFEELIRRFNEENNEEAGEHFTPRDVVRLMAKLIFVPIADRITSGTYLVYDGACGTGGMLTVAEETLQELARAQHKTVTTHLYGQEINPETYAIATADLLMKGKGTEAPSIVNASTLSRDGFPGRDFDFMLSNPPYGKSWKTDLDLMGGKAELNDPRFVVAHAGAPDLSLVTRSSDGQLLFLANMLSKMKHDTPLGSRIVEVHNGSSLFTGDAGQGESNIRRWIIENDWLEAIIALPLNMFYNTGIATYIWVLSNRKEERRRGTVQLIDATGWFQPLRKNLGKKNCELGEAEIERIVAAFQAFEETEQSRIFPNAAFGYWKVTVERPLRLRAELTPERLARLWRACRAAKDESLADMAERLAEALGPGPHRDWNAFLAAAEEEAGHLGPRWTAKRAKLLQAELAERDETAVPVVRARKRTALGAETDAEREAFYGRYLVAGRSGRWVTEYEPDPDLRDTEQVPLLEEGGIEAFIRREVLPYAPDAWVDEASIKIGYEISFTRVFYKPQPLRTLDQIRADIRALQQESEGLMHDILREGQA